MDYAFKVTTHGRALIAACGALEKPLKITRAAVGSGKAPEDVNLADVHELYSYVADGTIGERRHDSDRLYLTVQYANNLHPEQRAFQLAEFMVFAQDPETGEETDLLYATLGDYSQPVPSYRSGEPAAVFNYPMVTVISDEIQVNVTAPPGIVFFEDLQRLINAGVIGISCREITVPPESWSDGEPEAGFEEYPYTTDIALESVRAQMTPIVTFYPASLPNTVDVCPIAVTYDGGLKLFAKTVPGSELRASLSLLGGSGYIGPSSGGDIPPATADTLGGIIVGEGLNVDGDGKLSVNIAPDAELQKDIADILARDDG